MVRTSSTNITTSCIHDPQPKDCSEEKPGSEWWSRPPAFEIRIDGEKKAATRGSAMLIDNSVAQLIS
jgi:hypothetical protein